MDLECQELGVTVGWPQPVRSVASVGHSLPPGQHRHSVISQEWDDHLSLCSRLPRP